MKQPYIEKLLFVPTGSYNPMGVRPYTTHVTGDVLNELEQVTDGFRDITAGSVAGIAGRIIKPAAYSTGTHSIVGGWQENRLMFMMKVIFPDQNEFDDAWQRAEYITGWTDHGGDASYSGHLDPRMEMHVDRVICTRERVRNNHLIQNVNSANLFIPQYGNREHPAYTLRPRDVAVASGNMALGDPVESDFRNALSSRPVLSTVGNDLPADYMSRLFRGYRLAMNRDHGPEVDLPNLMSDVANSTGDEGGITDPFLMGLSRNTHLAEGSFFTYGELCRLYRDVDKNAIVIPPVDLQRQQDFGFGMHSPQDSEHWGGSNNETLIATMISTGVPAMMVSCLLTQCSVMASNDTVNGQPEFRWLAPPQSFMLGDEDLTQQMAFFEDQFLRETFRYISNNGLLIVSLRFHSDLVMSDTRLEVSVDGGPFVPFCVPNFAAGMITPVLGNQRSQLDDMAQGFSSIFQEMAPQRFDDPDLGDFDRNFQLGNGGAEALISPSGRGSFKL